MLNALASNVPDALLVAGGASVSFGAWLIYPPAGFIVAGMLLMAAGFVTAKGGK